VAGLQALNLNNNYSNKENRENRARNNSTKIDQLQLSRVSLISLRMRGDTLHLREPNQKLPLLKPYIVIPLADIRVVGKPESPINLLGILTQRRWDQATKKISKINLRTLLL
jgi:hypothetical protein